MKKLLLAGLFFSCGPSLFCQDTLAPASEKVHETKWSAAVGYVKPFGKWTMPYDFTKGESYKILSNGGHALWGVKASLSQKITMRRKPNGETFGILFYPFNFQAVFYDQQTVNGPALLSKRIRPFLNYDVSVAPFYGFSKQESYISVYSRFGISGLWTKGKVYYQRTNFSPPNNTPQYTGNDLYSYSAGYSYLAVGGVVAPGIKIEQGRYTLGIEASFELYRGNYSGSFIFRNYAGRPADESRYFSDEKLVRFHGSINLSMAYSFGK